MQLSGCILLSYPQTNAPPVMRYYHFAFVSLLVFMFSCSSEPAWQDIEKELQTKFILAGDGDVIEIPAGHFKFKGSLSLDDKKNVTIKGAGMDKTILSFAGQTEGAEGLTASNSQNLLLEGFTIQNTKGDAIKTRQIDGIVFRNVTTEWTGGPDESNGSYGFYPVNCQNVLLEGCVANGASDAGIYVGQSNQVIVRNCTAKYNVAGIEIENCRFADVYENHAFKNTGGVLVFDMPGLSQSGGHVRVFNNEIYNNNLHNFAPEGNIVGTVPPGTGVMIVATSNVDIFDNNILRNKTMGAGIVSYASSGSTWTDTTFNPYSKGVSIRDNNFDRGWGFPILSSDVGKALLFKFPFNIPDIVYDGTVDPLALDASGKVKPEFKICIKNNKGGDFVNADYENGFKNLSTDLSPHDCEHPLIEAANPIISKL